MAYHRCSGVCELTKCSQEMHFVYRNGVTVAVRSSGIQTGWGTTVTLSVPRPEL